jgi:hypothetical protein
LRLITAYYRLMQPAGAKEHPGFDRHVERHSYPSIYFPLSSNYDDLSAISSLSYPGRARRERLSDTLLSALLPLARFHSQLLSIMVVSRNWTPYAISLLRLPTEVLHEIARSLHKAELIVCCRVSRLLNSVAMGPLYEDIFINEPRQTILCCKTLSTNVSAARMVKCFAIQW